MREPKQERARETRRRILNSAAVVFARNGYAASAVEDILKESGTTRGALYFHFASKEDLAKAVVEEQTSLLPPQVGECPLQAAIDASHFMARELQDNPLMQAGVRLVIEGSFTAPATQPYREWTGIACSLLEKAQADGIVLKHISPRKTAELIIGCFTGLQLMSETLNGRADLSQRLTDLWEHILPGLGAPYVLPRIDPRGSGSSAAAAIGEEDHRPRAVEAAR